MDEILILGKKYYIELKNRNLKGTIESISTITTCSTKIEYEVLETNGKTSFIGSEYILRAIEDLTK